MEEKEVKYKTFHKVELIILLISYLVVLFEGMILCSIGQIPVEFSKIPYFVYVVLCLIAFIISMIRSKCFDSKLPVDKLILLLCNPIGIAITIVASLFIAGFICLIWGVCSIFRTGLDG